MAVVAIAIAQAAPPLRTGLGAGAASAIGFVIFKFAPQFLQYRNPKVVISIPQVGQYIIPPSILQASSWDAIRIFGNTIGPRIFSFYYAGRPPQVQSQFAASIIPFLRGDRRGVAIHYRCRSLACSTFPADAAEQKTDDLFRFAVPVESAGNVEYESVPRGLGGAPVRVID
jgi:hypothetical protein